MVGAGDILIEEGEAGRGLFLVLRGEYDVVVGAQKVATLKSGEVFGEISLLRASPTTATVTARTQGEILFLARDDFAPTLQAHPGIFSALNEMTTKRLVANQAVAQARVETTDSAIMV
jgi:CRP-like cAMP-binding protein